MYECKPAINIPASRSNSDDNVDLSIKSHVGLLYVYAYT